MIDLRRRFLLRHLPLRIRSAADFCLRSAQAARALLRPPWPRCPLSRRQ
jgi:hypothetical protein